MANERNRALWEQSGVEWVRLSEVYDRMIEPFGRLVLDVLDARTGERILDVGCGFGTTLDAIDAAGAVACGIDISPAMVDAARRRVPHADVLLGDAQTNDLAATFDGRFDAVVSRFGVMFFDDPVAAFANLADATNVDGRLVFVCWRAMADNPIFQVGGDRLLAALPEPPPTPPPGAPGPTAFGEPDRVRTILAAAGWADVSIDPFDAVCRFATADSDGVEERIEMLLNNELGRTFRAAVPEAEQGAILDAVRADLRGMLVDGQLSLPASAWIVTARRD
jgi:SAM-dependent methyltransferase